MRWAKRIVVVTILVVLGFFSWSYFAGGLKLKRDIHVFSRAMESCSAIEQSWTYKSYPFFRSLQPGAEETCDMKMSTASPQLLACTFEMSKMPALAESFIKQADYIDLFGVSRIHIDINSDDPLQVAMNSAACQLEDPA